MKRFISISLLFVIGLTRATACSVSSTHNWYLFSVLQDDDFKYRFYRTMIENWIDYTDGAMDYWFDAKLIKETAHRKGDTLMLNYLDYLQKYLDIADDVETETWDYPTKEELASQRRQLNEVRSYAMTQLHSRLRSQHALLVMRCNMLLGLHEENISFWEQTASQLFESIYRDMMRNIYAGALLKCGRTDEATTIYTEQGDLSSLYTYFYDKRSAEDIAHLYAFDPDSPAMAFLLQDFANNAQETIDDLDEWNWPGKLFVSKVAKEESERMCQLARQAVKEGKTSQPALWKSLEAWLQYLSGDKKQAAKSISEAIDMKGSQNVMDNARVLRLYITADAGKADDDFMAQELSWLEKRISASPQEDPFVFSNHYMQVFDRLTQQVLVGRYRRDGRPAIAALAFDVYDRQQERMYQEQGYFDGDSSWNNLYDTHFFCHLDTIATDDVEQLLAFKPKTALEKWLAARMGNNKDFLHEVLGTKYLRQHDWQKAIDHLKLVPMDFVASMNIAPFMAQRNYTTEPWLRRQWLKEKNQLPGAAIPTENQKLLFANEMLQMEQAYQQAKGLERQQLAYQLAVRYYQASLFGDAWYITCYGKSTYYDPDNGYPPFVEQAHKLLDEAAKSADYHLREMAIYARAFSPDDNWHEYKWDEDKEELVAVPIKTAPEYLAMKQLADFARANSQQLSPYVSRCDVLKQFLRQQ